MGKRVAHRRANFGGDSSACRFSTIAIRVDDGTRDDAGCATVRSKVDGPSKARLGIISEVLHDDVDTRYRAICRATVRYVAAVRCATAT